MKFLRTLRDRQAVLQKKKHETLITIREKEYRYRQESNKECNYESNIFGIIITYSGKNK